MHNTPTADEVKGAYQWLIGFGIVAVCLAIALASIDNKLTYSDRETRVNDTLKEIRSAQASFESRNVDRRLLVTESVNSGN